MDLISRICPVCHSNDSLEVFDQPTEAIVGIGDIGYHHRIKICKDCGFVFASPLLPEEKILLFYEKMSNYEHPQYDGLRPETEKNQIYRYLELINNRLPPGFTGRALDIGCATAFGLSLLKSRGWCVLGVDPSQKCVDLSKKYYDVRVIKGFLDPELFQGEKPFDLIVLCHVLEHLVNPDQAIKDLSSLLSDDGLVYIEVPNLLKPDAPKCYFCFEHVNFFTPTSLTNIMSVSGLSADMVHTFDNGLEISPFYPVIASTWKKSKNQRRIRNNFEEALAVIKKFKRQSEELVSKLQKKIRTILDSTPKGRLAIWGGGIHTSQLLGETMLKEAEIACIFDNDPKKHGSWLLGHEIVKFPGNPGEVKKRIDSIVISSEASEDIIYEQICYLENHGVKIWRLYGRSA
jgi:2-polyprenyl-3-methyl-5-hydroxy-6-metoxy-1,4-benzoquinol methylase